MSNSKANNMMQDVIDAFQDARTLAYQSHATKFTRVIRDRCVYHGLSEKQATIVAWVPKEVSIPYDVDMDLARKMLEAVVDNHVDMIKATLFSSSDTDTLYEVLRVMLSEVSLDFT